MSIRLKIFGSTRRGKKYFRYFRQKLLVLKELEIFKKAYIVNGYKILLQPLLDKILIWCPPGVHVFHFKRSTYTGGTFVPAEHLQLVGLFTHDNYGYQKETIHKAPDMQHLFPRYNRLVSYSFDGWPGRFVTTAIGDDIVFINVSSTYQGEDSAFYRVVDVLFAQNVSEDVARNAKAGFGAVAGGSTITTTVDKAIGACAVAYHYLYDTSPQVPNIYHTLVTFRGEQARAYGYLLDTSYQNFILPISDPPHTNTYWQNAYPIWIVAWHNPLADDDVYLFVKYYSTFLFSQPNTYYAFYKHQFSLGAVHPTYIGGCLGETVLDILETLGEDYDNQALVPLPTHRTDVVGEKSRNVAFPVNNSSVVLINYPDVEAQVAPVAIVINTNGTASVVGSYTLPYTQQTYSFPLVEPLDVQNGLYLYWEEHLFGRELDASEYSNIYGIRYGNPATNTWLLLTTPPIEYVICSFNAYKITAEEQIVQAVLYREDIDPDKAGMYTGLLDTTRANDWVIGNRFSPDRLERCQVQVYNEHPYTRMQRENRATRFSWPFLYVPDGDERVP